MAQGMGLSATPRSALRAAAVAPACPAPSSRDRAIHSELVTTRSTSKEAIAGPAAAGPSRATSSGTPMKPVFGKADTSAPKAASFQRIRSFRLQRRVTATISSAQGSHTATTEGSNRRATGMLAPKRYSMQGKAKYNTKALSPPMDSIGSQRRFAAT